MLSELRDDNLTQVSMMKQTHQLRSEHTNYATTSLVENWIEEAERRAWFLFESIRNAA